MTIEDQKSGNDLPPRSARLIRLLGWYAPRLVRKKFNAVRVLGEVPSFADDDRVLFYLNHPSWWDPMAVMVLVRRHFMRRTGYGPIDAAGLAKYRFLEKLGFFGIEMDSRAGAQRFLELGRNVLQTPGQTLWVTAQGHFVDPRVRPVTLMPGVAHLARRAAGAKAVPLALEYPFWEEQRPEMLMAFGEPIALGDRAVSAEAWNACLEKELEVTMDRLGAAAAARDAAAFTTLLDGRRGVNPAYDLWRRGRAALRGDRFDAGHSAAPRVRNEK